MYAGDCLDWRKIRIKGLDSIKGKLWLSEHEVNPHFHQFVIQFHYTRLAPRWLDFMFKQATSGPTPAKFWNIDTPMPEHSNYLTNILIDPVAIVLFIERVQEQSVNAKFKGAERKEETECVALERAIRTKSTVYTKQKKRNKKRIKTTMHTMLRIIPNNSSDSPCR